MCTQFLKYPSEVKEKGFEDRYLRFDEKNAAAGKEGQGPVMTLGGPVPRVLLAPIPVSPQRRRVLSSPDKAEFIGASESI